MDFKENASGRIETAFARKSVSSSEYVLSEIPGDLSPRRYLRVTSVSQNFQAVFKTPRLVAMVFDSIKPPEAEAEIVKTSDVAFLELAEFFSVHELPVPKIYLDARDIGVVLLEDLGETPLIELVKSNDSDVSKYYTEAVSLIHKIQSIPVEPKFFAFNRSFDSEVLKREMSQFLEFVLPADIDEKDSELCLKFFSDLATMISQFKKVLVHRDFHSWNLMVDNHKKLRLIDFQDALMGPRSYDLVALLHERDIDLLLERSLIDELEDLFFAKYQDEDLCNIEYPMVQLQRDIKVSGLFLKVKKLRGLESYSRWVPGTLKRIGKTLDKLSNHNQIFSDFKTILVKNGVTI